MRHSFLVVLTVFFLASAVQAAPFSKGAEACQQCHRAEYQVWEQTKHFASFRDAQRNPKAKEIITAVGGSPNMKANQTCTLCHYTMIPDAAPDAAPVARSGPSCESCHGASSDWLSIHSDYGGPSFTKDGETPDHKTKRFADAGAAGWLHAGMKYDIASKCMSCHGLANSALDGGTLSKMFAAGHPANADFEVVRYSQGSVRHRFFPPSSTVNAEMTPSELARFFVTGQAAKLVSATQAQGKSKNPEYKAFQKKRADDAVAVLSTVKSIPEVAQFITAPTEENARKLVSVIGDKDLSSKVGSLLPDKATYK